MALLGFLCVFFVDFLHVNKSSSQKKKYFRKFLNLFMKIMFEVENLW